MDESFLSRLIGCRGNANTFCCKAITALVEMMLNDDEVADYIYQMPGDTLAHSRVTDWWIPYMDE
jgi:hypothetical protein